MVAPWQLHGGTMVAPLRLYGAYAKLLFHTNIPGKTCRPHFVYPSVLSPGTVTDGNLHAYSPYYIYPCIGIKEVPLMKLCMLVQPLTHSWSVIEGIWVGLLKWFNQWLTHLILWVGFPFSKTLNWGIALGIPNVMDWMSSIFKSCQNYHYLCVSTFVWVGMAHQWRETSYCIWSEQLCEGIECKWNSVQSGKPI